MTRTSQRGHERKRVTGKVREHEHDQQRLKTARERRVAVYKFVDEHHFRAYAQRIENKEKRVSSRHKQMAGQDENNAGHRVDWSERERA